MTTPFDLSRYQDPLTIQRVIYNAKTIAIVGLSKNGLRASYFVSFTASSAWLPRKFRSTRAPSRTPRGSRVSRRSPILPVAVDIVNAFRAPDARRNRRRGPWRPAARTLVADFGNQRGRRTDRERAATVMHGSCLKGRTRNAWEGWTGSPSTHPASPP